MIFQVLENNQKSINLRIIKLYSGLNDGFVHPLLFLSIYLLEGVSVSTSIGHWFLLAWLYHVVLSIAIGIVVGYIARKLLYLAEKKFVS